MSGDTVSSLWTRLVQAELHNITGNTRLWNDLLSHKPTPRNISTIHEIVQCSHSSTEAAAFFLKVVQYIEQHATDALKRLPMFIQDLASGNVEIKSERTASKYREIGNKLFKIGDWPAAEHNYRIGLLHAPNAYPFVKNPQPSREAALLHGNLSAVLARQEVWDGCLWESLIALDLHLTLLQGDCSAVPCKTIARLWERLKQSGVKLKWPGLPELARISCPTQTVLKELYAAIFEQSKEFNPMWSDSDPALNLAPNDSQSDVLLPRYGHQQPYPGLSEGLLVQTSAGKGRHVIATHSFVPGDILAVEPSYGWVAMENMHAASQQESSEKGTGTTTNSKHGERSAGSSVLLLAAQRMDRCGACLAPLHAIGFICPGCCDMAYCAPPSRCFYQHCTNLMQVPCRFEQPDWHKTECQFMFLLNSTGLGHLCFRLALLRHWDSNSASRCSIDTLVDHFEEFLPSDLFEYALTGWLLTKLLRLSRARSFDWSIKTTLELSVGLWCFDTLRRLQCNAHAITEVQEDINEECLPDASRRLCQMRIATGLFPNVSMLNHSCDPSVANDFHRSYIVLRCVQPIQPGDEVYNCYGPHYQHQPCVRDRKAMLREQYYFECDCVHCVKPECLQLHQPSAEQATAWQTSLTEMLALPCSQMVDFTLIHSRWKEVLRLGTYVCGACGDNIWWPQDNNPGSLMDTIGRDYLTIVEGSSCMEKQEQLRRTGWRCLLLSVQWVRNTYGPTSTEYLWELINFIRLAPTVFEHNDFISDGEAPWFPRNKNLFVETIIRLATVYFGKNKAVMLMKLFLPQTFIDFI